MVRSVPPFPLEPIPVRHALLRTPLLLCGILVIALQIAAGTAAAQTRSGEAVVSLIGTVTAIDTANRTVSLRDEQGTETRYYIDPRVKYFENTKIGDRVRLDYRIGVAVSLAKGGDNMRERVESQATIQRPVEGKPKIEATRRTTMVADVLAVDQGKKTLRLKGPEGRVADVEVADPATLTQVKAGDRIVAVVDEAVVVGVESAPPAK